MVLGTIGHTMHMVSRLWSNVEHLMIGVAQW